MKNQSECVKGQGVSFHDANYEITSNENVNFKWKCVNVKCQCESNQDKSESRDSHYDASANSWDEAEKYQLSAKKPETTLHTRPVRERKMPIRFNDSIIMNWVKCMLLALQIIDI